MSINITELFNQIRQGLGDKKIPAKSKSEGSDRPLPMAAFLASVDELPAFIDLWEMQMDEAIVYGTLIRREAPVPRNPRYAIVLPTGHLQCFIDKEAAIQCYAAHRGRAGRGWQ